MATSVYRDRRIKAAHARQEQRLEKQRDLRRQLAANRVDMAQEEARIEWLRQMPTDDDQES